MSTISSKLLQTYPRSLFIVLALGLALRLGFVAFHQRSLISDEKEYDQLAWNLSSKGMYSYDSAPTAYRPVGYPAFVGAIYYLTGHRPIAVKFLQAMLDLITALLLYHLLSGFSKRTRLLGTAFWVFFPPAILYTNFLMSETLFVFLLVASFDILKSLDSRPPFLIFLLGLLMGILVLIKPNFIIFLIALPLMLFKIRIPFRQIMFVVLGFLILVAPWLIRNYMSFDHVGFSSNGGINLLIGNNPNTTGAYVINYPEEILQNAKQEFEADRTAFRYATKYIVEHPITFVTNGVKKLAHLFESEGGLLVWSFHGNPEDATTRYSAKYASTSLILNALVNLPYALFLILGVMGFVAAPRDKFWLLTLVLFVSWIITHTIFFGGGRFHFPLMPFFVFFAAYFLTSEPLTFKNIQPTGKAFAILMILFFVSVWIYEATILFKA
ncbi:MAG: hypothetical protein HY276_12380 [Ignavibacteriales bacterium]|nr:hypothetical protein [Ignavibacteriales bacterium]MBI3789036.1 hypothetical protein [Ignavibacteriales bacterium]